MIDEFEHRLATSWIFSSSVCTNCPRLQVGRITPPLLLYVISIMVKVVSKWSVYLHVAWKDFRCALCWRNVKNAIKWKFMKITKPRGLFAFSLGYARLRCVVITCYQIAQCDQRLLVMGAPVSVPFPILIDEYELWVPSNLKIFHIFDIACNCKGQSYKENIPVNFIAFLFVFVGRVQGME